MKATTYEDITACIEDMERGLRRRHVNKDVVILTRLSVEDAMCKFCDRAGEKADVTARIQGLISPCVVISSRGDYYNPLEEDLDRDMLRFAVSLEHAGITPTFMRHDDCNVVMYRLPARKVGDLQRITFSIIMAIIAAIVMHHTMNEAAITSCVHNILDPVCNVFLGLLTAVVVPLIFFSVVKAFMNAGDGDSMSKLGKMLFRNVLGLNLTMLFIATVTCMIAFGIVPQATATDTHESTVSTFLEMFFPNNAIQTFANGKTAQVLFIAVVTGLGLLQLKERVKAICDFVTQVNELMMLFMSWIAKLLPLFIFVQLLILLLSGKTDMVLQFGLMFVIYYAISAILYIAVILYTTHLAGTTCLDMIRITGRVFIVGLSTMSSIISIPTMMECCTNRLGVDRKFCGIMIPTVVTMNRVLEVNCLTCISLCGVYIYGVTISWEMFIMFLLFVYALSIATPSVPGGVIATLTMLFGVLDIPMSYIALSAMIIPFMEFDTGVQTVSTVSHVYCIAKKMGKTL